MQSISITFTVILVGDSGVGKSSIMSLLVAKQFVERHNDTVNKADTKILIKERLIQLKLMDIPGKEPYRQLSWAFYRGCPVIVLVFDLTSRDSYDNLRQWFEEMQLYGQEDPLLILIGNKCDAPPDKITVFYEEGDQFASTHNMIYYQTSGKIATKINDEHTTVDQIFTQIAEEIMNMVDNNMKIPGVINHKATELRNQVGVQKKRTCC